MSASIPALGAVWCCGLGVVSVGCSVLALLLNFPELLVMFLITAVLALALAFVSRIEIRRSEGRKHGKGLCAFGVTAVVFGFLASMMQAAT
jgi:hypothetical protein